jgi:hypothetical protein
LIDGSRNRSRAGIAERTVEALDHRRRRLAVSRPLLVLLEADEEQALVGARPREAEPGDRERAADFGHLRQRRLDLLDHAGCVGHRGALRGLHDDDEVALVLFGEEARRHRAIDPDGEAERGDETAATAQRARASGRSTRMRSAGPASNVG